jgi:hypothetical protein
MNIMTERKILSYLRQFGYNLLKVEGQNWYKITGNDIYGYIVLSGFYRENRQSPYIYVDHKDCFDKESKCPLSMRLPLDDQELDYLAERLRFWGSKKGFEISNNFQHELYDNNEYPRKLKVNKRRS